MSAAHTPAASGPGNGSGHQPAANTFVLPHPEAARQHNKSGLAKSSSEAKFSHSGFSASGSHAQSSVFKKGEYGDKLYDRQSASTLLHSISAVSFPKAQRFAGHHHETFDNGGTAVQSTLSVKSTNFSKVSERKPLIHVSSSGFPGPGTYQAKSQFTQVDFDPKTKKFFALDPKGVGRSFGLAASAYKNTFSMDMDKNIQPESELRSKPGPGQYKLSFPAGKAVTIAARFNESFKGTGPGPIYEPNYRPVEPSRYNHISAGSGQRYDFTKATLGNPGPEYNIPSKFDKYRDPREDEWVARARQHSLELLRKKEARIAERVQAKDQLPEIQPKNKQVMVVPAALPSYK